MTTLKEVSTKLKVRKQAAAENQMWSESTEEFYSDAQPRDPNGRWAPGGSSDDKGGGGGGGKGPIPDEEAQANIQAMFDHAARNGTLEKDAAWYQDKHDLVGERAAALGVDPDTFTGMVAATSPLCQWESQTGRLINIDLAEKAVQTAQMYPHLTGKEIAEGLRAPGMLPNSLANAVDIYSGLRPINDVLSEPKTRAFYNNLINPNGTKYVTIDSHVWRAILGDPKAGNDPGTNYKWAADQIRVAAKKHHMSPLAAQAVVWCQWKREHEFKQGERA